MKAYGVLAVVFGTLLLVLIPADSSYAGCPSSAQAAESSWDVGIVCNSDDDSGAVANVSDSDVTYSWEPVCSRGDGIEGDGYYGCGGEVKCGQSGVMFTLWVHFANGSSEPVDDRCLEPSDAPDVVPLTQGDVLRAFRRMPVPASEVVVQPPGGETLVNLDTVFSTHADRFTRTVGLLGREVELEIWPTSYRWVNGDGSVQTTDWPGERWVHGAVMHDLITHRYQHADHDLVARVDTTWTARYRVNGGEWRDVGGTVTITGEPYGLAVRSASPALTG